MNHLTTLLSATLILLTTVAFAQIRGNGNVVSEKRFVDSFTSIEIDNSIDIFITEGNSNTITVKADENLLPIISTKVSDGVLVVSNTKSYRSARVMEVHVVMKSIDRLFSSGSGDIYCEGNISGNNVYIKLNGSGDLQAAFAVKNLEIKLNGSGDAEVSGVRGDFKVYISGSGDLEAEELQLENCVLKTMGSGDIKLSGSTTKLTVKQTGSGDVNAYNMKAVDVTVSNSGSGDMVVHAIENLEKQSLSVLQRIVDKEGETEIGLCAQQRIEQLEKNTGILGKIFN